MQNTFSLKLNKNSLTAAILLAVSLVLLVWFDLAYIMPIKNLDVPNYDNDLSVFWVGTRTVWQGGNPYDHTPQGIFQRIATEAGGEADIFFSPFFFTLLFAPFALFPLKIAALLWLVTIQVLLIWGVLLTIRLARLKITARTLLIGVLLAVFWRYSFQVMILNNLSIPIFFLVVLSYYLSATGKPFWAGVIAAFLLLKPQLIFLTLPVLLVVPTANESEKTAGNSANSSWLNRATYRRWLGFGATCLVFAVYSFAVFPGWIGGWLGQASSRVTPSFDSEMTSVRSIIAWLVTSSATVATIYYVVAALGCAGVVVFWWYNRNNAANFTFVLSTVICANILLAPYIRSYDFVLLLLPLIAGYLTVRQTERKTAGKPKTAFHLSLLWLPLLILHWPLHILSITLTFAWENLTTLSVLLLLLLAWQVSRTKSTPTKN